MSLIRQLAILMGLSVAASLLTGLFHPEALPLDESGLIQEGEITLTTAREMATSQPVLWLDARTREQYEADHIPGAVLLNEDEWNGLLLPVADLLFAASNPPTVIVYCDSRACAASHQVAERLQEELGYEDVVVLHGGWETWQEALQP